MNDITEKRGIASMPAGEVATVHLIPWGDGQQGVLFTYASGRKIALPIDREQGPPRDDRRAKPGRKTSSKKKFGARSAIFRSPIRRIA